MVDDLRSSAGEGRANRSHPAPPFGSRHASRGRSTARQSALRVFGIILGAPLGLALLVICALVARLAFGPLSINWFADSIREQLGEHLYYAYDVEFSDVLLDWTRGGSALGLRLEGVKIHDYSKEVIGEVPAIEAEVRLGALLAGRTTPAELRLEHPAIRWLATTGGAVKFDIGGSRPGISGKILEDIMILLAAAPGAASDSDQERQTAPTLVLADADITIGSEVDGSTLHAPAARIVASPDGAGVRTVYDLTLDGATGAPARLLARSLFRTSDQRIALEVEVSGVRPRELVALVPALRPIAGLDAPASGTVSLDMDKYFTIGSGTFDVTFGPGRLSHAEWGLDVPVESGRLAGQLADSARDAAFETVLLDFGDAALSGRLDIDGDGRRQRFGLDATISGLDRAAVARRWPAAVRGNAAFWLGTATDSAAPLKLTLTGSHAMADDGLLVEGIIDGPPTRVQVTGTLAAPMIDVAP